MTDPDFILLPAETVLHYQAVYERARQKAAERRYRYEEKHSGRKHGKAGKGHGAVKGLDKPFICWDGEGPADCGYALFGNSEGMEVCHYGPLGTRECLDLIIDAEIKYPDAIHIIFGGNYDVSNILNDLPRRKYNQLIHSGTAHWEGYIISHVPRKWFTVRHGKVTARIYDIISFFDGNLTSILTEWKIGPWSTGLTSNLTDAISTQCETAPDTGQDKNAIPHVSELAGMSDHQIVAMFKKMRSEFTWKDIEAIRYYMRLELKYTVQLMNRIRSVLYQAGYLPKSWHGPGAIATMALRKHGVFKAMAECPEEVREAARYAYAGGRFEEFLAGWTRQAVHVWDLHSAYPHYARHLPNLAKGAWRWSGKFEKGKFAVYWIEYHHRLDRAEIEGIYRPYPLFRRLSNGNVIFPPHVKGWYWSPEAELVADDPDAIFLGGWVFDEDDPGDRPFAWIGEYYERKESAKRRGDQVGWVWKKIINSVYGQLCRKTGWDQKNHAPPKSHQLEWAGYITSACRASVYRLACACGRDLVSIDTDGVASLSPVSGLKISPALGDWEYSQYSDGIFWQSGIYFLKKDDDWEKYTEKSRGIPKGTYTAQEVMEILGRVPEKKEDRALEMVKHQFISYRTAMLGGWGRVNTWVDEDVSFLFGGAGKRRHNASPRVCKARCRDNIHRLGLNTLVMPASDLGRIESLPHPLPWIDDPVSDSMVNADYLENLKIASYDMQWARKERKIS